ncbi:MAG: DUF4241 domain-containing protein [Zoogloeaceae bacterium]|jgi:hypothetical protein|nr:DUF4241 domain-containing protein [Zoogloeaceae bacterium]
MKAKVVWIPRVFAAFFAVLTALLSAACARDAQKDSSSSIGKSTLNSPQFYALQSSSPAGSLTVHPLGNLILPSGKLEASDPFVGLGDAIAVINVPAGTYPVFVTICEVEPNHFREAYLSVVFSDAKPAGLVLFDENGAIPFSDEAEHLMVFVDAGTVAFADSEAIATAMPDHKDWYAKLFNNGKEDLWFSLMDSPKHLIKGSANIVMPNATQGENVVMTHSGWGDGAYSIVGTVDAAGKLLAVHIDLGVAYGEEADEDN